MKRLYEQLAESHVCSIEWIIKDSGKCAATRQWWAAVQHDNTNVRLVSGPDGGLYEAINLALGSIRAARYIVVGSDDIVSKAALLRLVQDLDRMPAAMIALPVLKKGKIIRRRSWVPLWVSAGALTASHSVGLVIPACLHQDFGPYDQRFPILADSHFLIRVARAGHRVVDYTGGHIGEFMVHGVSSLNPLRVSVEAYAIHLDCGYNSFVQALLLFLRLVMHRRRITDEIRESGARPSRF